MTNMNGTNNENSTNNENRTNKENKKVRINKTAFTAIALTAVIGVGSIGGLAFSKFMRTNSISAQTAYAENDETIDTLRAAGVLTAISSAEEAALSAKEAELAAEQATAERIKAEEAAAKASASEKAAAEKLAEQKRAAEEAAKKKAEEAKKREEEAKKKEEEEKAKKPKVDWSAVYYYANSNGVTINHYTNGKYVSDGGVEYTDNGDGTMTGTDGSLIFSTEEAADKYMREQNHVDWSAEYFYATGNSVTVNHYTNGQLISEDGVEYKDNGDGTLTGSDGSTLFSTREAADAYAEKQNENANPDQNNEQSSSDDQAQ